VRGVSYLQANRQEVASLLGHPERWPDVGEISAFVHEAFRFGVRAVFVTMGKEGVLAATPRESRTLRAPVADWVVDTTGCGDVFSAKTMQLLALGVPVFEAAEEGVELASRAAGLAGVRETYELALNSEGR
jgi:sugar/nucleoside kinase (ribokinase family)